MVKIKVISDKKEYVLVNKEVIESLLSSFYALKTNDLFNQRKMKVLTNEIENLKKEVEKNAKKRGKF